MAHWIRFHGAHEATVNVRGILTRWSVRHRENESVVLDRINWNASRMEQREYRLVESLGNGEYRATLKGTYHAD